MSRNSAIPTLLPPPLPRWPSVLRRGAAPAHDMDSVQAALRRIRAERLYWPAPRARARRPRAAAFSPGALAAARLAFDDADVVLARDPEMIDPERLEAVFSTDGPVAVWALLGGLRAPVAEGAGVPDASTLLGQARGVSPWTGETLNLEAAVEAQALLRASAMRGRGPVILCGMTPWKRRCVTPFLTGPDGPPRRRGAMLPGNGQPRAVWGAQDMEESARAGSETTAGAAAALRIEDGFLRSIGLGLRHTPPLSLAIAPAPPYFDATRRNGFEDAVSCADFTAALTARAAALRTQLVSLGLTKYNVGRDVAPPDTAGREAILAPGQVEDDASIRLGARDVRRNIDLLAQTRRRFPDAFILYKPHPDVLTGWRPGGLTEDEARRFADAVLPDISATAALAWADRIATITSLMGFEALLRGKAVTTFGRPFYAGWGLTDDLDPPPRDRSLTIDELTAAALILYPSYIDPATRLPAPAEIAVAALARQRADADLPRARLTRAWRDMASWMMARF